MNLKQSWTSESNLYTAPWPGQSTSMKGSSVSRLHNGQQFPSLSVLTIVSIRLVPVAVDVVGWRYALLPLAAGPLLGTVAMLRLRQLPAALCLANGRR